MGSSPSACMKLSYNLGMPNWDADCEVEQAYELQERAEVARDLGEDSIAELFEQAARLAMAKAEVLQALDKLRNASASRR
jgi:propanediol dehydratase small subunit